MYTASNVEFVTKSRVEHLSEADKKRHKNSQSPLQSLLGTLTEEKIVGRGKQEEVSQARDFRELSRYTLH